MPTGTILHFIAIRAEQVASVLLAFLRYFLIASVTFHGNFKNFAINQDKLYFSEWFLPQWMRRDDWFIENLFSLEAATTTKIYAK